MAIIKGCYQWNETLTAVTTEIAATVNFRIYMSGGMEEVGSSLSIYEENGIISLNCVTDMSTSGFDIYDSENGFDMLYSNRLMDFGEEEQEVSEEFATYLLANAVEADWDTVITSMYKLVSGAWRWNDTLPYAEDAGFYFMKPILVNGVEYGGAMVGGLLGEGIAVAVLANFSEDEGDIVFAYLPMEEFGANGWIEPVTIADILGGTVEPVPSESSQIWDFGEGAYIEPLFEEYLKNNAVEAIPRKNLDITYKGEKIASAECGQKVTLCCNGKSMQSDLVITAPKLVETTVIPTKETQERTFNDYFAGFSKLTVSPIPAEYIIPEGTKTITANGYHGVTEQSQVYVDVPIPEGYVQPSGTANIYSNGTHNVSGKASAYVNVPIPSGYLKPEGEVKVTGNTTSMDIAKYATLTVEVPELINGIVHEYKVKAGANVNAGDFVEFFMKYGSGQFGPSTATNIQIYKLDEERVAIGYISATNYGNVVVIQLSKDGITIGEAATYHTVATNTCQPHERCLTVVNSNRVAVLWNYKSGTYLSPFLSAVKVIDVDGVKLTQRSGYTLFEEDTITGAAIIGLDGNRVLYVGKGGIWPNGDPTYDATVCTISSSGAWSSQFTAKVGYNYTSSNVLTKLTDSKVLCTWVDSGLKAGVIGIGESSFETGSTYTASDVTSFAITAMNSDKALAITKNAAGAAEARILTIGGTTVTFGTATTICESCTGAVAITKLSDTKAIAFYNDVNNENSLCTAILECDASNVSVINTSILEATTASAMAPVAISSESAVLAYTNSDGTPLFTNISIQDDTPVLDTGESGAYVYKATSNMHNVGVAKTSGAEGEFVEVYRVV